MGYFYGADGEHLFGNLRQSTTKQAKCLKEETPLAPFVAICHPFFARARENMHFTAEEPPLLRSATEAPGRRRSARISVEGSPAKTNTCQRAIAPGCPDIKRLPGTRECDYV